MSGEDHLAPTDLGHNSAKPMNQIIGYSVQQSDHGYGGGGKFKITLAIDPETAELYQDWDNPEKFNGFITEFYERIEKGGVIAGGTAGVIGAGTILQNVERANYDDAGSGDGSFRSVGNQFGMPDMQDFAQDGEVWQPAHFVDVYLNFSECYEGMTAEQLAETIRQAYYQGPQALSSNDVPNIIYRGEKLGIDMDFKPQCAPNIPVS